MQLKDTIYGMLSADPRERLQAEVQQAYIRMNELEDRIGICEEMDDLRILKAHHKVLSNYFAVLLTRAANEGIEIHLD